MFLTSFVPVNEMLVSASFNIPLASASEASISAEVTE